MRISVEAQGHRVSHSMTLHLVTLRMGFSLTLKLSAGVQKVPVVLLSLSTQCWAYRQASKHAQLLLWVLRSLELGVITLCSKCSYLRGYFSSP